MTLSVQAQSALPNVSKMMQLRIRTPPMGFITHKDISCYDSVVIICLFIYLHILSFDLSIYYNNNITSYLYNNR